MLRLIARALVLPYWLGTNYVCVYVSRPNFEPTESLRQHKAPHAAFKAPDTPLTSVDSHLPCLYSLPGLTGARTGQ